MVCTIFSALPFVNVGVDTRPSTHTLYITPTPHPIPNSKEIKPKGPFQVPLQWKRRSGDERKGRVSHLWLQNLARVEQWGAVAAQFCLGWSGPDDNIITASSGNVRLRKQCPSFPPKVSFSFPGNVLFGPAQEEEDEEEDEEGTCVWDGRKILLADELAMNGGPNVSAE